jgi:hypothetical protein
MDSPNSGPSNQASKSESQVKSEAVLLPPLPAVPVSGQYFVHFNVKNENIGPLSELAIRNMIQNRHLGITDMICEPGDTKWTVLSESKFAQLVISTTSRSQMQSSACPNCQAHMVVTFKSSTGATILIIMGIFTVWAIVGFILIVIGYVWKKNSRTAHYICPRCNYKT